MNGKSNAMSKRKIYYFCLLVEEGIAYYLTFKWKLIIFACIISVFPTVMVSWSAKELFGYIVDWGIIFFLIWLAIMNVFLYEFPLPEDIKEKVRDKIGKTD